ncbi:MAG: hypothetical protein ACFFCW_41970 [Candidatus Hodarchaeota archaeon]
MLNTVIRVLQADRIFFKELSMQPPHRFRRWELIGLYWLLLFLNGTHWFSFTSGNTFILHGSIGGIYSVLLGSLYLFIWFNLGSTWASLKQNRLKIPNITQYPRDIMSLALLPQILGLVILKPLLPIFYLLPFNWSKIFLWSKKFLLLEVIFSVLFMSMGFLFGWFFFIFGVILYLIPFWGWSFYIVAVGISTIRPGDQDLRDALKHCFGSACCASIFAWIIGGFSILLVISPCDSVSCSIYALNLMMTYFLFPIVLLLGVNEIKVSLSSFKK